MRSLEELYNAKKMAMDNLKFRHSWYTMNETPDLVCAKCGAVWDNDTDEVMLTTSSYICKNESS